MDLENKPRVWVDRLTRRAQATSTCGLFVTVKAGLVLLVERSQHGLDPLSLLLEAALLGEKLPALQGARNKASRLGRS